MSRTRFSILFLFLTAGICTGPIAYSQNAGSIPGPSPTLPGSVPPTSQPGGEDIRDIRGPVHIPSPWRYAWYAAAALAALAAASGLWWMLRQRAARKPKQPHEIALEKIDQALLHMEAGRPAEFSVALSDAVREYIESRFLLRAAHKTTEEFLHDLLSGDSSPLSTYSNLLGDFLNHCDLAKFARWSFSIPEMKSMHESARRFVVETQPRPENNETQTKTNHTQQHQGEVSTTAGGGKKQEVLR